MPEVQVSFYDRRGRIGVADFFWRELGLVGEFDGDGKYGNARRFAPHLSAEEVVIGEKKREDRLRALGLRVVRWNWRTALNRGELALTLAAHGLPPAAPRV